MGGLAVLLIIAAYIGVACVLVYKIKPRKWKVVVVVAAILIPTADAVVGRLYLKHLCATEAGLKVHRVVENVEGFLGMDSERWLKEYGYQFVESSLRSTGNVAHRVSLIGGKLVHEWNVPSKSLYRYRHTYATEGIYRQSQDIVDVIRTGEILAAYTQFSFMGGWAERLVGAFSDAGASAVDHCELPQVEARFKDVITESLKPRSR